MSTPEHKVLMYIIPSISKSVFVCIHSCVTHDKKNNLMICFNTFEKRPKG